MRARVCVFCACFLLNPRGFCVLFCLLWLCVADERWRCFTIGPKLSFFCMRFRVRWSGRRRSCVPAFGTQGFCVGCSRRVCFLFLRRVPPWQVDARHGAQRFFRDTYCSRFKNSQHTSITLQQAALWTATVCTSRLTPLLDGTVFFPPSDRKSVV